jgi:imidazolonepropionase-like amidohydrolase
MGHSVRAGVVAVWLGLALGVYFGAGGSVAVGLQEGAASGPATACQGSVLALVGGQVLHLEPQVRLVPETVLVEGDRITAVGAEVSIPEGADLVELNGLVLAPGLIDAHSRLWLMPDAAGQSGREARLSAVDGLDAFAEDWPAVVAQGVTAVYVQPGSADICAGTGVVLSAVPDQGPGLTLLRTDAALQAALGTGGASSGKARRRQAEALDKLLGDARQYQKQWEEYRRQLAEWEQSQTSDKEEAAPPAPAVDLSKERLVKVLEGTIPLRLQVNHPDDIERGLALAEKFGVRLVLEGVADVGRLESRLSEQRWPAVLGAWMEPAVTAEASQRRSAQVRLWGSTDRLLAITSGGASPSSSAALRASAAAAIAAGVDPDQALRAITLGAARILGIDQELGSIEVGKRADLVALTGHPLAASSRVMQVWVAGRAVPLVADPHRPEERVSGEAAADPRFDWQPHEPGWNERLPSELPDRFRLASQRLLLPDGEVAAGTLWIERGRILRVELDSDRQADGEPAVDRPLSPLIDLGQMWVTPGLVDCHHVPPAASSLIDEPAEADARQLRAVDAIDPSWPELRQRVRQGQLSSWLAPGGRNVLAGRVGLVRWGPQLEVLAPDMADKWVLAASARDAERFPASLLGQRQMVEQLLAGEPAVTRLYVPPTIQRAWTEQRRTEVQQLLAGERWVIVQANSGAERRVALELAEEHGLQVAVVGLRDIDAAMDGLLSAKATIIARPVSDGEDLRYVRELVRAAEAGIEVLWSFRSVPALQWTLGQAVAEGLSPQRALRSVTSAAAQTMPGLSGSSTLESGSAADLVIWDGPLHDVRSRPRRVMLGGRWAPDDWQPDGE